MRYDKFSAEEHLQIIEQRIQQLEQQHATTALSIVILERVVESLPDESAQRRASHRELLASRDNLTAMELSIEAARGELTRLETTYHHVPALHEATA